MKGEFVKILEWQWGISLSSNGDHIALILQSTYVWHHATLLVYFRGRIYKVDDE